MMEPPRVIDPARTIVFCYQYGGFDEQGRPRWRRMKVSAAKWLLETFPKKNIYGINIYPYIPARNRPIRDLVLPNLNRFDHLLSIDYDITITHPGLEHFLGTEGDVVACKCLTDNRHAWDKPNRESFHTGFWRASTKVFKAIKPPWFQYGLSDDGCEYLSCDCEYFARKALALGFSVTHGGRCGHQCGSGAAQQSVNHKPWWYYKTVEEGTLNMPPEDTS